MQKAVPLLTVLAVVIVGLSGCLQGADLDVNPATPLASFQVVDDKQQPIPYAQIQTTPDPSEIQPHEPATSSAFPYIILSADAKGTVQLSQLPATAMWIAVSAPGFQTLTLAVSSLEPTVKLAPGNDTARGFLRFLPRVDLACPPVDLPPFSCSAFGEPVVEVAGDGTIWASATCCIGKAPPIWRSTDGGKTFNVHSEPGTGLIREGYGIEGDFAIDDAGNVYFFDIALAGSWFTSWDKTGKHRWTVPMVFPPLVDRPWVRAGKADEVFILYNTGQSTNFYHSTDGGLTWDLLNSHEFPCYLGGFGQGFDRNTLYVAASCGKLWTSKDGGQTWDAGQKFPTPKGVKAGGIDLITVPVADEAGNVYVPFTHFSDNEGKSQGIYVSRRNAQGNWSEAVQVSPGGVNEKPWAAAGKGGYVGLAWYHADEENGDWRLMTAASIDAASDTPHYQVAIADPEILLTGPFGRNLGDFLESDLTPDGRFVVVYAKNTGSDIETRFVSSDGGLNLGPLKFLNGPKK